MTICAVYSIHTYICSVYIYIYIYIHWKHPPNSKSWEIPTLPWPLPEKLSIGASWWIKSNGAKRGLIFQKQSLKKLPKISHNHGSSGKWNHPKWKETHHYWRYTHWSHLLLFLEEGKKGRIQNHSPFSNSSMIRKLLQGRFHCPSLFAPLQVTRRLDDWTEVRVGFLAP